MSTTIFVGGSVFDGGHHIGAAEVLVRDGIIEEVGPDLGRDGAEVVDLDGGLLAPGFVDAHVHAVQGGLELTRCNLSGLYTRDEYRAAIAEYAAAHPDLEWILGAGWSMAAFPGGNATVADLDDVVPDRPVFLVNRDHHGAWVNTRALDLAGIAADTPDPPHGRFERDAEGRPNGTLHEGAMHAVDHVLPPTADAEYDAALVAGQGYLQSFGVTGWQDAIIGAYSGMDDCGPAYRRAAERGDLTAHVVGALWWDRDLGVEQVASLMERRTAYTYGRFRATSVKVMQDGIAENGTAAMSAPYLDRCGHPTTNTGHSFVDPDALREYAAVLDAEGFQVHIHAIGDRAVREALDALTDTRPEHRHHIAHLQLIAPDDVQRFAELGVSANLQALWATFDEQMEDLTLPFLDAERAGWQYLFGDLHRAGARLVMGSDWPVTTPDPLQAIHVAVNRWAYGAEGRAGSEPFLPGQALALETAFAAYTSGSAWVNSREDAGRVAPGAVADLVVLDRDPFAGPVGEIGATGAVSTWVDGVRVFER